MPNRKGKKRPSRNQAQLKSINDSIKTLTLATQDKALPSLPDVMPLKVSRKKIHQFSVKVDKGFVTANAVGAGGALSFSLNDTPTPSDFTSLFDKYRIAQVVVEFLPLVAQFGPSTTSTALPYLITVLDYDDDTTPGAATLQQYENAQIITNQEYHRRVVNPKLAVNVYGSGVFGSFAQARLWCDSNNPAVRHYGVKWATTPITVVSGSYNLFSIVCTYIIQCKNTI